MFLEYIEDLGHHLLMMFDCMGIYEDIVHVDHHIALIDEVFENVIPHHLEGGQTIGKAEEYDKGLEEAPICLEGSLPLVPLFDLYVVVSPTYVKLHEVLCLGVQNSIDEIWYKRERVGVFHCHCIKLSVVLDESQFPIFLFHKEYWGCHWRLGGAYMTAQ